MIISTLLFMGFAHAQSKYETRVNDHLIETSKKIEIEQQQKEVELQKDKPDYLEYDPPIEKKKQPFVVEPPKPKKDPTIFRDQYDHPTEYDPSVQVEQDVIDQRELANEQERAREEYIREFKENAARAGVKVEVDPRTLKARPVGGSK